MSNPVEAYPMYIKPQHIMEATQYGKTTTYELIHEMEVYQEQHKIEPRLVNRRPGGKGIRIHRDGFFRYFAGRENISLPEELKQA